MLWRQSSPQAVEGRRIDDPFCGSLETPTPLCHASPEIIGLPKLSLAGETKGQVRPEISGENGTDLLRFFLNFITAACAQKCMPFDSDVLPLGHKGRAQSLLQLQTRRLPSPVE